MPATTLLFYRNGLRVPALDFLLEEAPLEGRKVCFALLTRLQAEGHELRRPHADVLRHGIYELRAEEGKLRYRILYFFDGQALVVVSHVIVKKTGPVPAPELERALRRKQEYEADRGSHCIEVVL